MIKKIILATTLFCTNSITPSNESISRCTRLFLSMKRGFLSGIITSSQGQVTYVDISSNNVEVLSAEELNSLEDELIGSLEDSIRNRIVSTYSDKQKAKHALSRSEQDSITKQARSMLSRKELDILTGRLSGTIESDRRYYTITPCSAPDQT